MKKSFREYIHQTEPSGTSDRTRNLDSMQRMLKKQSWWWNSLPGGAPTRGPALLNGALTGSYKKMTDVVTPGFKERSKKGEIINSPMSKTEATSSFSGGDFHFRKDVSGVSYHGEGEQLSNYKCATVDDVFARPAYALLTYVPPLDTSTLIGLASTAARAKVSLPSFTGLVSLGEMSKTLRYLRNPFASGLKLASTVEKNLEKVARNRMNGKSDIIGDLSSIYLEFRYGVRPLIYEVERALTTIAQMKHPDPVRETGRAFQGKTQSHTVNKASDIGGISANESLTIEREYTVRCGLLYELIDDYDPLGPWGMELSDIPAAMWELTPLSFVYDWVGNIGDFISAMTPVGGIKHLAQWTTIRETRKLTVIESGFKFSDWNTVTGTPAVTKIEVASVTRYPSVNYPSLEWKGFDKLSNDALKVLDLIGIFKQKLAPIVKSSNAHDLVVANSARLDRRMNSYLASETQRLLNVKKRSFHFNNPGF